jgi:hypothetical protein
MNERGKNIFDESLTACLTNIRIILGMPKTYKFKTDEHINV